MGMLSLAGAAVVVPLTIVGAALALPEWSFPTGPGTAGVHWQIR